MQAGQKALHHPLRGHLDPAELGNVEWVEEIESGAAGRPRGGRHCGGPGHEGRNVLGFPAPGNVDRFGGDCPATVTRREKSRTRSFSSTPYLHVS
jgi:hypothetical protein